MRRRLLILGVITAALVAAGDAGRILSFTLQERENGILKKMGPAEHSSAGAGYKTLEYVLAPREDEDYDLSFYFDQPSGDLVSVTRNFAQPMRLEEILPLDTLHHHTYRDGPTEMAAISRLLPGGRVLIAIGLARPADPCSQVVLIRKSALPRFYPWIARDLM